MDHVVDFVGLQLDWLQMLLSDCLRSILAILSRLNGQLELGILVVLLILNTYLMHSPVHHIKLRAHFVLAHLAVQFSSLRIVHEHDKLARFALDHELS